MLKSVTQLSWSCVKYGCKTAHVAVEHDTAGSRARLVQRGENSRESCHYISIKMCCAALIDFYLGRTPESVVHLLLARYFRSPRFTSVFVACSSPTRGNAFAVGRCGQNGMAYDAEGGIYFDVGRLGSGYGKLGIKEQAEGMQDDVRGKRSHKDFALWKRAKPGEPS